MRWYFVFCVIPFSTTLLIVRKEEKYTILGLYQLLNGTFRLYNQTIIKDVLDKSYIDPIRQLVYLYKDRNPTQLVYNTSNLNYYGTVNVEPGISVMSMDWLNNQIVSISGCSIRGWDTIWRIPSCGSPLSATMKLVVNSLHSEAYFSVNNKLYKFTKEGVDMIKAFNDVIQDIVVDSTRDLAYILSGAGKNSVILTLSSTGQQIDIKPVIYTIRIILLHNTLYVISNYSDYLALDVLGISGERLTIPGSTSGAALSILSPEDTHLCEVKISHNATEIDGTFYFLEGTPLRVSCFVVGPSMLTIRKETLTRKDKNISTMYGVDHIEMISASAADAGLYYCTCVRGDSVHEVNVRLDVQRLNVSVIPEMVEARPGQKISYSCTAISFPYLVDLKASEPDVNLSERICSCGVHKCFGCSSCASVCRNCNDECVAVDRFVSLMTDRAFNRACYIESTNFFREAILAVKRDYRSPSSWFFAMLVSTTSVVCLVGIVLLSIKVYSINKKRNMLPDCGTELPVFDRAKLIMKNNISAGNFSDIVSAQIRCRQDDCTVLKEVVVKVFKDSSEMDIINELRMMKRLKHNHILGIIGIYKVKGKCNLVLPIMVNGDLKAYLKQRQQLKIETPLDSKVAFLIQAVKGMSYLSQNDIVHRDLAARNMLLTEHNVLKIGDFGLARQLNKKKIYRRRSKVRLPVKCLSPESWKMKIFSSQSDTWCFGVLIWEVMTNGDVPYKNVPYNELKRFVCDLHNRLDRPEDCPANLYKLMTKCWSPIPSNRPSTKELFEHLSITQFIQPDKGSGSGQEDLVIRNDVADGDSVSHGLLNTTNSIKLNGYVEEKAINAASMTGNDKDFSVNLDDIAMLPFPSSGYNSARSDDIKEIVYEL